MAVCRCGLRLVPKSGPASGSFFQGPRVDSHSKAGCFWPHILGHTAGFVLVVFSASDYGPAYSPWWKQTVGF
jgi:hypothetical protein